MFTLNNTVPVKTMKLSYKLLLTCGIALFISSNALGQEFGISYLDESYESQIYSGDDDLQLDWSPPVPVLLNAVTDSISNDTAGQLTTHQVGFLVPEFDYQPYGLLRGRQIVITFPPEFNTSTIISVSYRDTDDQSTDPIIEWVYIYAQSVVVVFDKDIRGPNGNYHAYINLTSIQNPVQAGSYRVAVKVDNRLRQTIAGPSLSDAFDIIPDEPHTITIEPAEDLNLSVGQGILFKGIVEDKYGNLIEGAELEWELDPSMDMIGTLYGSFLLTSKTGIGRVLAEYGDLEGSSGLITVSQGNGYEIRISQDADTVTAGQALHKDIIIEIVDQFGNRMEDYAGQIWFSSNDSQAEIIYNEENPYQFTEEDKGRRVFAGADFIFKTPGPQILTVTDGARTASNNNIFVISDGAYYFDVSYPEFIYAGQPFDLVIENAIDNVGNPFYGKITVTGGEIAPDGTTPIVPDIYVFNGSGATQVWLFAAGANAFNLSIGDYSRELALNVEPGNIGRLEFELDERQYVGHTFYGSPTLTVFDRFDNLKTNISESGIVFEISVDDGQVLPSTISSDLFGSGEASLIISDMVYTGPAGRRDVTVSEPGSGATINTEFYANGVNLQISENYQIASVVPQGWHVSMRGNLWNPGNETPISITYETGFVVGDTIIGEGKRPFKCIPLPYNASDCRYYTYSAADVEPGQYEYINIIEAFYKIEGDTIITTLTNSTEVEVLAFDEFVLEAFSLPVRGFSVIYEDSAKLILENSNSYPNVAQLNFSINIVNDDKKYFLGALPLEFNWESQTDPVIPLAFSDHIAPGNYQYEVRIAATMVDDQGAMVRYESYFNLDNHIDIVDYNKFSVDGETIIPRVSSPNREVAFTFELNVDGINAVLLDGGKTFLSVTDGSTTGTARMREDTYELYPGSNSIKSGNIFVPESWKGKDLTGTLKVIGSEAGILPVDTTLIFDFPLIVQSIPALKVISVDVDAPNAPYLNVGQRFGLVALVANLSTFDISPDIVVRITTSGNSLGENGEIEIVVPGLMAGETAVLTPTVFADTLPNPLEEFKADIDHIEGVEILPSSDNQAVIVIQKAVSVDLSPAVVNIPGVVPMIDYAEQFAIQVTFENFDRTRIEGGLLELQYSGPGDFGIGFPNIKDFDSLVVWQLTAPRLNVNSAFYLVWKEAPLDLNTGEPINVSTVPIEIRFVVREAITRLEVIADPINATRPLQRGVRSPVLSLAITNSTNDVRNNVELKTIVLSLFDKDDRQIDARNIVCAEDFDFYINDQVVGQGQLLENNLAYKFSNVVLFPSEEIVLELQMTPDINTEYDYFRLLVDGKSITAQIIEGPRAGTEVPVTGLGEQPLKVNFRRAIIAETLQSSFKNYPNPFDPGRSRTELRYFLDSDSDVDIHIYTATGEKVIEMHFAAGSTGGSAGPNLGVFWDGRNGKGDMVLNGVYIAVIEVSATGQKCKLKMAVVK